MRGTDAEIGTSGRLIPLQVALFAVCCMFSFDGNYVFGQTPAPIVASVKVQGNRNVPTSTILANLQTKVERAYDAEIVRKDLARLSTLGSFQDAKADTYPTTDGRVEVVFTVREHPNLITEVKVKNARHVKLDDVTLLNRIRRGTTLNPSLNKQAANEIRKLYQDKGYTLATVYLEEGANPNDTRVIFNVTEGPKTKVRSVRFEGNVSLATDARLRTQINSKQALLRVLGGSYNPAMLDHDVHKLEEYYRRNGYLDVRISRELQHSYDLNWVDVTFHIKEGPRYRVAEVSVDGVENLPDTQVESVVSLRKGDVYNENKVETDLQNIKDSYGWRGYQVPVKREHYYPQPGLVHVRYQVIDQPRPPAKVGQVIIVGNEITKRRVINRVLGIYPGQTLQYPMLRQAERNLARLNIFNNDPNLGLRPTVTVQDNPNNPSEFKDVIVNVQETATGSLIFGASVNSNSGLVGQIVLNERNFDIFRPPTSIEDILEGKAWRGGGQELRIEAVPGTELQRYTISFREPFLFDLPYSLTTAGYYYDRVYAEYTEGRVGGRMTLGHQLNDAWSISGGFRIENVNVSNVQPYAPPAYTSVIGDNFLIAPRVSLVRDTRDSFLRPTEGSRIESSYEHVLGDYTFPVFNVEGNKFFTTFQRRDGSGKHVLALRSQFSWQGDDAPVFEKFFAGGFRSLRGFEFRGVGPMEDGFSVGGNFMFLASAEYQIPVLANDNVYLVAFLDSGTVEENLSISDYRVSAGFGARFLVPGMGPVPISLDFGFPINKGPNDLEQIFSFYVGFFR